jgi:hypothetical protein
MALLLKSGFAPHAVSTEIMCSIFLLDYHDPNIRSCLFIPSVDSATEFKSYMLSFALLDSMLQPKHIQLIMPRREEKSFDL